MVELIFENIPSTKAAASSADYDWSVVERLDHYSSDVALVPGHFPRNLRATVAIPYNDNSACKPGSYKQAIVQPPNI